MKLLQPLAKGYLRLEAAQGSGPVDIGVQAQCIAGPRTAVLDLDVGTRDNGGYFTGKGIDADLKPRADVHGLAEVMGAAAGLLVIAFVFSLLLPSRMGSPPGVQALAAPANIPAEPDVAQ